MEYQHKKECKRHNELRDYERVFVNEKLLFRNGIIYQEGFLLIF